MTTYPGDNPDFDDELRYGDTVFLMTDDTLDDTEYMIVKVGTSAHGFDYIIKGPDSKEHKVKVSEVLDQNGKTLLVLSHKLDVDTTDLPALQEVEEYELLGTEASRAGQFVVIRAFKQNGDEYTRKTPIVVWGHYMVKAYAGDKLMPLATRTTVLPMITLPKKLEPVRVPPELFVDYYFTA